MRIQTFGVAAVVILTSCGDETIAPDAGAANQPPVLVRGVAAQTLRLGGRGDVDLTGTFSDPDGDTLAYTAASSDTSVVFVAVLPGPFVALAGLAQGEAAVTVVARDPEGLEARAVFPVSVTENPDRAALVALYEATDGPNWERNHNWLTDAPLSQWYGVTVNDEGRVAELDLQNNGLTGPIPPELGNLTALEGLILSANGLTGPIPPELGNLAALAGLWLQSNGLTGPIPPELGNLTALERLYLFVNDLTGSIPPELGNLTALERLGLSVNGLTGSIPPELGRLSALEDLELNDNDLTGPIPPELGNLTALEKLELNGNGLTGPIPPELGNLTALKWLHLGANDLTGPIPPELGNLTALGGLYLEGNELTGPIPPELGNLTALGYLELSGNEGLSGPLPATLTALRLVVFDFSGTGLCVPGTAAFWGRLRRDPHYYCNKADRAVLERLHTAAGGSDWTRSDGWLGTTPVLADWHGVTTDSLGRVAGLALPANNLAGQIAPVGALAELESLDVGDNPRLSGPLPLVLTRLALDTLRFSGTGLCSHPEAREWLESVSVVEGTGETCEPLPDRDILVALYEATGGPEWRGNANWLTDAPLSEWHGVEVNDGGRVTGLDLYNNGLTGPIPPELGNLTALEELVLGRNGLTGPIPPELGNLTALDYLGLFDNALTGPIPPELGNLIALERLWLRENGLTGPIPPELGNLTALEELGLGRNGLTGLIPPELGNLIALERLWLRENDLTGPILAELGNLAALEDLRLGGNGLTGPIPPELGNLTALEDLRLGGNDLTGPIPAFLGNLTTLERLYLGGNDLTGPIPAFLGNLSALTRLELTGNDLTGPIPPELGNLTALEWLWLSGNSLTGPIPPELGNLAALKGLYLDYNEGLSGPLPATLAALRRLWTRRFSALDTGLCAPADAEFQRWLEAVRAHRFRACDPPTAHLVQSARLWGYAVPLVAGREALLRVFPTAPAGDRVPVPPVRATFYAGAAEVYTVDAPGKPGPLPTEIEEGDLAISANAKIPGHVLRPGLEMVVEIDPDGTLDTSLGVGGRIPESGRVALDVRSLPTMELTIVPFLWTEDPDSSILAVVEGMAADPGHERLRLPRALLPASDWKVTAHEPVWTDIQPVFGNHLHMLSQTTAVRTLENGRGYWMGTIRGGGAARSPGWTSVSALSGATIAHELGHNLSLGHAPCGNPSGFDSNFPDRKGRIGAWGYDFTADRLVSPRTPDVMSYCGPAWIGDYHFTKALNHRLRAETGSSRAPKTMALLLWGGDSESGGPRLEPAFVVDAAPVLPDSAGGYTLTGRDAGGRELFSLAFAMPEISAGDEAAGGFAYTLPIRPGWEALASVTLTAPDGRTATLDGSTDRPMSILRDPRTGRVRAFLGGDVAAVQADGGGEDLAVVLGAVAVTSRGLPSPDAWRR